MPIYILEYLRSRVFLEAGSVRDHLGYLSPGDFVSRAEGPVGVA